MDQKQLERFVDVVESGSLSRTARRLNVSQPALSKSLRLLEEQIGARLLDRGPRGVRLTVFGQAFYRRARSITSEFRRAKDDINHIKGMMTGSVSIGVTPGPGVLDQIIPKAVTRVARKRPNLDIRVRSGTISELLVDLQRGDLDLLLTVLDERTRSPDLEVQRLFDDRFALMVRKGHDLLLQDEISVKALMSYRWAILEDALVLWETARDLTRLKTDESDMPRPIESNSLVFLREVIRTTDFIGIIPAVPEQVSMLSSDLSYIPLERILAHNLLPNLVRPLGLVHAAEIELTESSKAMLRAIVTVCIELKLISP